MLLTLCCYYYYVGIFFYLFLGNIYLFLGTYSWRLLGFLGFSVCLCVGFSGSWVFGSLFIWFFVYLGLGVFVYWYFCLFVAGGALHYLMFLFMVFMADVACKRGHPDIPARCPLHAGFSPSTHPLCRFAKFTSLSDTLDVAIFYSLYVGLVSTRNYYVFRPTTHNVEHRESPGPQIGTENPEGLTYLFYSSLP